MEKKQQSRKRLRPWLEKHCNQGTFQGLQWLNRSEKIFRISWKHQSNRCWESSDAEIFKAWALFSGKFKEGDPENPPEWKTRLRTALTKLTDVEEIKCLHNLNHPDDPFKAYKFLDDLPAHHPAKNSGFQQECSPLSDYSTTLSPSSSSKTLSPSPQMDFLELSDSETDVAQGNISYVPHGMAANIPTVVNDMNKLLLHQEAILPRHTTDMNVFSTNLKLDRNSDSPHLPPNILFDPTGDISTNSQQPPMPSDLESIRSDDLLPPDSKCADNMSIGSSLPSLESNPSIGLQENSGLRVDMYFMGTHVCTESMEDKARIFCGDLDQHALTSALTHNEMVYGPLQLKQIGIPDVDKLTTPVLAMSDKHKDLIRKLQNRMERGLLLGTDNKHILAQRLCKARVFLWTREMPNQRLGRESIDPSIVFDLDHFNEQLQVFNKGDGPQPHPYVIFSFGQEFKPEPGDRPHMLLYIKVVHKLAEKRLQEAMRLKSQDEDADVLESKSNSGDLLACEMNKMLKII